VSGWGAAELANTVRAAGVEAETVIPARQLPADEHLAWRDFFTAVDHPEWGSRKLIGFRGGRKAATLSRSRHRPGFAILSPLRPPGRPGAAGPIQRRD
jgi:crotonobetainyl-CoA:carnitine CoA-transferase CaiB-like acyl-CoA transferase